MSARSLASAILGKSLSYHLIVGKWSILKTTLRTPNVPAIVTVASTKPPTAKSELKRQDCINITVLKQLSQQCSKGVLYC